MAQVSKTSVFYKIYLDTKGFSLAWNKVLERKGDWTSFLDECWTLCITDPKTKKSFELYHQANEIDPMKWSKEKRYEVLSPKAYTKAKGIQKRMNNYYDKHDLFPEDGAVVPDLPRGARQYWNKASGSARTSTEDILTIFGVQLPTS